MSSTLPFGLRRRALVRILIAQDFGEDTAVWKELPMLSEQRHGFELLGFNRACLPAVGEARIRFRYGLIDGRMYGASNAAITRQTAAEPWNVSTGDIKAPDLDGYEIRILVADPAELNVLGNPVYRTQWWGQVETTEDAGWPAAGYAAGERIYHCTDGLFRTKRWMMNRHAVAVYNNEDGVSHYYDNIVGHPGYNVGVNGLTIGNKANSLYTPTAGDSAYRHTHQGSFTSGIWSDAEAIEHAMRATRPYRGPLFSLYGNGDNVAATDPKYLYSSAQNAWPVSETESAWDFLARVVSRKRGRGVAFLDWPDDSANNFGALQPRITIQPQTLDGVQYVSNPTTGATIDLPGATAARSTTTVDLTGDHRAIADRFQMGQRFASKYDRVISTGERIQSLVTLSYYDGVDFSLSKRWLSTMETDYAALAPNKRTAEFWRPVWQLHGLPRAWAGKVGDHNNSGNYKTRCDYRTTNGGGISVPTDTITDPPSAFASTCDTSPLLVRILPDLPIYEGYDYSTSIPSATGTVIGGAPNRRPPLILIRTGAGSNGFGIYLKAEELPTRTPTMHLKPDGLLIQFSGDVQNDSSGAAVASYRFLSDTATTGLRASYDLTNLGITVGLELPHRLSFTSTDQHLGGDVKRTIQIDHPGLHLWLAHPGAIWDLLTASRSSPSMGAPARRFAGGGTVDNPGVLRDDRAVLGVRHALACAWYLNDHRTAEWALKDCGFLQTFDKVTDEATQATTAVDYPRLGELVTILTAAGQDHTINTPITSVDYDHQAGVTTWRTDWCELDFS